MVVGNARKAAVVASVGTADVLVAAKSVLASPAAAAAEVVAALLSLLVNKIRCVAGEIATALWYPLVNQVLSAAAAAAAAAEIVTCFLSLLVNQVLSVDAAAAAVAAAVVEIVTAL